MFVFKAGFAMKFQEFAKLYCETQNTTIHGLRDLLSEQWKLYRPLGWVMLECRLVDSSFRGQRTIVPYGPQNTWKEPPDGPVSPRGLASDTSVVIAILPRESFLLRKV